MDADSWQAEESSQTSSLPACATAVHNLAVAGTLLPKKVCEQRCQLNPPPAKRGCSNQPDVSMHFLNP